MSGVRTNNYDIVRLLTLQAGHVVSQIKTERDEAPVARKRELNLLIKKLDAVVTAAEAAEEFMDGDV